MLVTLFRGAGSTGHVFLLGNGRTMDKGLAYSGFIGPRTIVAVVPTTPQILDFAIHAQTSDKQGVVVRGNVTVTLTPGTVVSKFDFTVDRRTGGYINPWQQVLKATVMESVLRTVLSRVRNLDVETATRSQSEIEQAVLASQPADTAILPGVVMSSCSIPEIEPEDTEIEDAIGAKERQAMLTEADRAVSQRRLRAAENERDIKTYEAETALGLETERAKLIEQQGQNKKREADADAEATRARLAPFSDVRAGNLVGAALMKMAESGRIGTLNIVPELLAALKQE